MPPPDRPYRRYVLRQLRELYEAHQVDAAVLAAIAAELTHHKRPAATALRTEVERRIAEKSGNHVANPTPPLGAAPSVSHDPAPRGNTATPGPARQQSGSPPPEGRRRALQRPSPDDALRPPRQFKRIEPLGVQGKPPKFVRPPRTDVDLKIADGMTRAARYAVALDALIAEMRREGQGSRRILLEDGRRIELDRGHHGYSFEFSEEADLFEDARVELQIGARRIEGQLVSISSGKLVISLDQDLGDTIKICLLLVDNTALLEALKERLAKIGSEGRALNTALADDAVANIGQASPPAADPTGTPFQGLDERQKAAIRLALGNSVCYLWGPPGTGKTTTLSVLIEALFHQKKRVLICSNTNRAVDQVLLKLCRTLTIKHEAMELGRILRLGRIAHDELRSEFVNYVSLDGIVERRSRDLKERKATLEAGLADIARRAEAVERLLSKFAELDRLTTALAEQEELKDKYRDERIASLQARDAVEHRVRELRHELEKRQTAGMLRRAFLRSEQAIDADIRNAEADRVRHDGAASRLHGLFSISTERVGQLEVQIASLTHLRHFLPM